MSVIHNTPFPSYFFPKHPTHISLWHHCFQIFLKFIDISLMWISIITTFFPTSVTTPPAPFNQNFPQFIFSSFIFIPTITAFSPSLHFPYLIPQLKYIGHVH